MLSIIFIALGVLFLGLGAWTLYQGKTTNETQSEVVETEEKTSQNSTEDNRTKGLDFEKFIVQKFHPDQFVVKSWTGDKYVAGRFSEDSRNPDLYLEMKGAAPSASFAVECKWRAGLYRGGIELAKAYQIEHYRAFSKEKNIPVFVVLGLGGQPSNPREVYVIPLEHLQHHFISAKNLDQYKRAVKGDFEFDAGKKQLR